MRKEFHYLMYCKECGKEFSEKEKNPRFPYLCPEHVEKAIKRKKMLERLHRIRKYSVILPRFLRRAGRSPF